MPRWSSYEAWWLLYYKRQKELNNVVPEITLILKNSQMAGVADKSSQESEPFTALPPEKYETEKQT